MKKWLIGLMCVGMFATAAMGDLSSPATLPIAWAGETGFTMAAIDALTGWDATGLGTAYAAPNASAKFDTATDKIVIYFDSAPGSLVCTARRSDAAALAGPYSATIEESADNATWSLVRTFDGSELNGTLATFSNTLQSSTRYVKFEYVTKPTGQNFGVGSVQISSGGPAVFGVNLDKQNGFTVEQGTSAAITATALNGTETYNYTWGTTMAAGDYTAVGNVFTILATAALGNDYTATVTATDSSDPQQQAEKAVTFSVVAPAVKYGIAITPPVNGTVTTTPATEAEAGATVTINATPAGGYAVGTKTVVGDDSTPITVTGNNFTMPTQPVTVTVAFVEASASRIIISQYTETETGTIPKGIEIWNVSGSDITFDAAGNLLDVKVAANGTNVPSSQVTASSGTLAAGAVWVIGTTNMTPDLVEPFAFNGDDAIVLELGGVLQDVIGTVGVDPGTAWTNNGVSTANQNIQLKSGITVGDVDGWTDPSERFEYVAAGSDLTGFGIAPGGSATFSVNVDKANGFTVEQGTSAAITATAQNGTETYNYTWGTTMAVGDYTAVGNVFTILDTAALGNDFTATVTATDSSDPQQQAEKTVTFSVVAPVVKYGIAIVTNAPANGSVTTTPATEAAAGAVVTVNASPVGGYAVQSIVVVDAGMNPVTVTGNSFTMPAAAVTVTVTFQEASASGELIISQYYEGASNNKWIEIYNPGAVAIDLAAGGYRIGLWANANREAWKTGTAPSSSTALSNSIPAGGTYLIKNSSAALPAYAVADITSGAMTFTGDDSVVLYTGSTYSYANVVDAFGMTGTNAMDKSFVRKTAVTTGVNTDFNAADWDEFTNAQVDGAAESTNERLGYHSTGAAVFGVSLNRSNGFTVEQGASDSITATAANGTAPYGYSWSSTLGGAYYAANSNVFTILATAPIGDYSATVTATDDAAQTASNTVTFSVTAPVVKYGIAIVTNAPANGTVTTTPATEAAAGATVTVNAIPAGGYAVQSIVVNGGAVTVTGSTFTMPAEPVTVTVTFAEHTGSSLFISEVTDPQDNANAKFVELFNAGASGVDLAAGQWYLVRQANGGTFASIALTGTVGAAQTHVVIYSASNFAAAYPAATYQQIAGNVVTGNGDDGYFLYSGGSNTVGTLEDAYGVLNEDGTGKPWEYEDARAVRNPEITGGNSTWTASEWTITDPAVVAVMTPGVHPDGPVVFSVALNRSNGFTVEQGASDSITATAANGTAPYGYSWNSTLGGAYYAANSNVFTILATAPTGSYSATVTATDDAAQTASNTVTFSVTAPAPKYAISIVTNAPANGTVTTTPATEAAAGATVTVNAVPAEGYAVESIVVNGGAVTVTGNAFTMPATPATVTVTFMEYTAPDALITFETATLSAAYAANTATLEDGKVWSTMRVVRGNTAGSDRMIGTNSARLYPVTDTNAVLQLTEAYAEPITKMSFWVGSYGSDNMANVVLTAEVSADGSTWDVVKTLTGAAEITSNLTEHVIETIPANAVYARFVATAAAGSGKRVNVDNVGFDFGVPALSVSVNRSNGFTVEQGQSDAITATAANGTGPYVYAWASTLGASYRTTNGNVFTILATAPTGSYSATVTATDSTLATAQKTVTFSVVGLGPGPAVIISGSRTGTVGVPMNLTITVTNETAEDWFVDLKDPTGADAGWDYANFPPTFSLTPTMTGTYVLVVTAQTGSGNVSNTANLVISAGGDEVWSIGDGSEGSAMFYTTNNQTIMIVLPTNYTLNAVYGTDSSGAGLNNLGQGLGSPLTQGVDYNWNPATRTISVLSGVTNRRVLRIGATPE